MGEVHITQPDDAVECPGRHISLYCLSIPTLGLVLGDDDATDPQCIIMTVPNVLDGDILNHLGPYQGIYIGTIFCT